MEQFSHMAIQKIMEELFYALSGFDTDRIYIEHSSSNSIAGSNETRLQIVGIPPHLIEPFRSLIVTARQVYNNPSYTEYASEMLVRICELRESVQTIEELYVALLPEMEIFRDLASLLSGSVALESFRTERVKKKQSEMMANKMKRSVEKWMNAADPTDLIEINVVDGFGGSFWSDKFKMKRGVLRSEDRRAVEESGKIVYLIRKLFKMEIVEDDDGKNERCKLFELVNMNAGEALLNKTDRNENGSNREDRKDACEKNKNIKNEEYLQSNPIKKLQPFKYGDNLRRRQKELLDILNQLIFNDIRNELTAIRDVLLMQCYSPYLSTLSTFEKDFVSTENSTIVKIGAYFSAASSWGSSNLCTCVLSNVSLSQYILRLLKTQTIPQTNPYLSVMERFSVVLVPKYLNYFVPEKTFTELKIINRFLFLISSSIYFIERGPKRSFLYVIYLLFMEIRNISIKQPLYIENDIKGSVELLTTEVSRLLNLYSLTCADVFIHWSDLIGLCMEYIQLNCSEVVDPKRYFERTHDITNRLCNSIVENIGENDVTGFIKGLEWEAYAL
ncbi:hypothetical protein PAEPH01_1017 [Pancytospora epiphaga]|nr:hypothetical protein PAEPH01_1017 [Pancytospora epiphaga]